MPNTTPLADLTTEVARLLDQQSARTFDGHLLVDDVNAVKGVINGRVLHAHDQAEVLKFSIAVAL